MTAAQPTATHCAWIDGSPASLEDAARAASDVLRRARRPLVAGLGGVSTEAQRGVTAIADRLGGVADWTAADADSAPMLAYQTVGSVTATYGEAAERADLVVYWRCAPAPLPSFTNGSRAEAITVGRDDLALLPGGDYEAIAALRAIVAGAAFDERRVLDATGVDSGVWRRLASRLTSATYAAVVVDGQLAKEGRAAVAAMTRLAQELHTTTRVVVLSPPSEGNRPGAGNVLAWQTGFPLAVCFGRGYPRYGPQEYETATLLRRGEVDAALIVDRTELASLDEAAREALHAIPRVVLTTKNQPPANAEVAFRVAGLRESGGSLYRADGPALRLPLVEDLDRPTAEQVLTQIAAQLADIE